MRNLFLRTCAAVAGMIVIQSCSPFDGVDELEVESTDAAYAIPLVNTKLSIEDLLEKFEDESTLTIDPDGLIRFHYSGDVLTKTANQVFAAINQTLNQTGAIPLVSRRQALPFTAPGGLEFDRMDLKAGNMVYLLTNRHNKPVTMRITMPTVIKNGLPLTIQHTLNAYSGSGDAPSISNLFIPFSLAGYSVLPENDSIYIEYLGIDSSGDTIPPSNPSLITISSLAFSYTEGYLGQQLHEGGRDTIRIDFFNNWFRGDVYFEDPVITFNFENSFGIPTRSIINVFDVFTVRNEVLPLQSAFITEGIDFPYPTIDEVGQVKSAQFVFNKNNSNIREVLGAGPLAIDYDVNAITNPEQETGVRGFVTDSSFYRVRVDVDLPLYGLATYFSVRDTYNIDFSGYPAINSASFKLVADNGMPLAMDIQGYFLDGSGQVLDSLLTNGSDRLVDAAPVDDQGLPTQPKRTITTIDFPKERFARIRDSRRLLLLSSFSTSTNGQQSVQIKRNQETRLQIGVILGVDR